MTKLRKHLAGTAVLVIAAAAAGAAHAQAKGGVVDRKLFGGDFSFNGLVRVEAAISTSGDMSPANQLGLQSNGRPINRQAGNPATQYTTTIAPGELTDLLTGLGVINLPGLSGPPPRGVSNNIGVADTITRYVPLRNNDLNYHLIRFEATPSITWGDWSLQTRVRAVYDPGGLGYEEFDYNDYNDINSGFTTGSLDAGRQYRGKPDYLGYEVDGEKNPIFFERSGKNYQVDLPAFFVQWTNGDITARLGNQSVA